MIKELFDEAKQGPIEDIDGFIDKLDLLEDKHTAAAIAAIATIMFFVNNGNTTMSKIIWTMIDNLADDDSDLLRLSRMKQLLFPESRSRYISVTPEIFKGLQDEARSLLELVPDATDEKRYYWKSIINGNPPPGIIIKEGI